MALQQVAALDAAGLDTINANFTAIENRLRALEKVARITVPQTTPPPLPSYTGGTFSYSGTNYTFNKAAQYITGFGYVDFNAVAANPTETTNAAILDYMIANNLPALQPA